MVIVHEWIWLARAAGVMVSLLVVCLPMTILADSTNPSTFLPDEIQGYVPQEEDGIYTSENLFDLLDGGAEVYRSFNVKLVVSRRYGKPNAPDILADVFDMNSAADAFGAFHHDMREGKDAGVGHESEMMGSTLFFWKDRYYVSILALRETPEAERVVLSLGRAIAERITRPGVKPEIARLLPRRGLKSFQISYFHDWVYLNTRYFLADENLLHLDRVTEGVLARYQDEERESDEKGTSSFFLMLVRYPSENRAEQGLERFLAGYLPGADLEGVARRPDGKWAAACRVDELVLVVLDATRPPSMERLVARVRDARPR